MNVLVACHCKHKHDPVFLTGDNIAKNAKYYNLYDADELAEAKRVFGIANIDYIEKKECQLDEQQHREWNKLPRKYDMIVSVHCPVYGLFHVDSDYKYIDSIQAFYKDVRDNLKPGGFFHLPYNLYPKSLINKKNKNFSLGSFNRHNSSSNVIKVMKDILGDSETGPYKLEIIDYKQRARIPFFIDTEKQGTWSKNMKSTFRHLLISFPNKTQRSSKTKKTRIIRSKHSRKTKTVHSR